VTRLSGKGASPLLSLAVRKGSVNDHSGYVITRWANPEKDAMPTLADCPRATPLRSTLALTGLATASLIWVFWPTLIDLARTWNSNPQYSHGYLVPGFAVLLLWLRRGQLDRSAVGPSWWGIPVLALGIGLRLVGAYKYYLWLEAVSLLPCLVGLWLTIGGLAALRWAWPGLLFLAFMIPLPYSLGIALAAPLQRFATVTSTFLMQMLGLPALAEGNVIRLNDVEIGIVEACSGLRMLMVFFALSTGVAMIIRRPLVDKLLLVASAIPIALVTNILRVTATGILHEMVDSATANAFFHDFAGWLMMPLALGLVGIELKILSNLLVDVPPAAPRVPAVHRVPPASRRPRRQEPKGQIAVPVSPEPTG
jgi:exosortase